VVDAKVEQHEKLLELDMGPLAPDLEEKFLVHVLEDPEEADEQILGGFDGKGGRRVEAALLALYEVEAQVVEGAAGARLFGVELWHAEMVNRVKNG
jgi:hypothetical protein